EGSLKGSVMSEETSGNGMEMEVELPPALVQFLNMLKDDQTRLRKDKAFDQAPQLKKFVALTLVERFIQLTEMLGTTMFDTHQLAISNALQLQKQRRWAAKHLRKLGAEVSDGDTLNDEDLKRAIDDFGQAFYALGSFL